jgi:hypothetical protein
MHRIAHRIAHRDATATTVLDLVLCEKENPAVVDLRTFDEVVWSATYPSETDV